MSTYFGACDSTGVASGSYTNSDAGYCFWRPYTCPGSGPQTLSMLGANCHKEEGGSAYVRVGIYNSTGTTLLAETGAIEIAVDEVGDSWREGAVNVTLQGGTDYILAWAAHPGVAVYCDTVDGTRSYGDYKAVDYSAGFPASLPTKDANSYMYAVRAKVDPATDNNIFFVFYS